MKSRNRLAQKFFREPWKGYAGQKNSAAQKAAQEWILSLDADEIVSPELRAEIRKLFAAPEKLRPFAAFNFPRRTFFCGRWIRHGDWYPDRQTRLWRRGQARWTGENVHERLEVDGDAGRLRADLLHDTAETIDRQNAKISSYSGEFLRDARAGGAGQIALIFSSVPRGVSRAAIFSGSVFSTAGRAATSPG